MPDDWACGYLLANQSRTLLAYRYCVNMSPKPWSFLKDNSQMRLASSPDCAGLCEGKQTDLDRGLKERKLGTVGTQGNLPLADNPRVCGCRVDR